MPDISGSSTAVILMNGSVLPAKTSLTEAFAGDFKQIVFVAVVGICRYFLTESSSGQVERI